MRLTLAILLLPLVALGQSFTVTVSSNGVIRFPTNFFSANSNALVAVTGTGTGSGSTGTVTSVGLTMPAGFSVANSPVTGAGTLAVTGTLAPSAGGTGITTTTAAGQALLAAANAADQRDALGLGTAATNNVPASGNAASGEVVLGSDTRLTDSRTPTSHSHDAGAITSGVFALARLATGTPHGSNFLRGDGTFAQLTTNDVPGLVAALAAGGGGTTNLVSSSAAGLAPQATLANAVLGTDGSTNVAWTPRNRYLASWTALENAPGTNASTVALFGIRGDGIPALVFTNNVAREANFTTWLPSTAQITNGLNLTIAAYSEGTTGSSNVVMQVDLMRLCCTGDGALDTNNFTTTGSVTSTLPSTVSVPTNLLVSLPTLTGIAAGDLVRVRLTRVVGSASDTNEFNLGVIAARLEER